MIKDLDKRAFNEVERLKKDFNETLIRKRFRNKVRTFNFLGTRDSNGEPIKKILFEGLEGSILDIELKAVLSSSQNFYIKFNSLIVYKKLVAENFDVSLNLELGKSNTLEIYSNGEIDCGLKLKGNIDIQELDNIQIINLLNSYYVASSVGSEVYFKDYTFFEDLVENFYNKNGTIKKNFKSFSTLIRKSNGMVYNYTLVVLSGSLEEGYSISRSDNGFKSEHGIIFDKEQGAFLPILSDHYGYGIVSFEDNSFFITYYNIDFLIVKDESISFDLKYQVKTIGAIDYPNEKYFNYFGFWFIDKNNDAYLVLSKDCSLENIEFFNSPIYLGKASRIKVYAIENEFVVFLSFDNVVTKIVLNITHDNLSVNASRVSKKVVKNVDFGFLDGNEEYYISNGCITKLT